MVAALNQIDINLTTIYAQVQSTSLAWRPQQMRQQQLLLQQQQQTIATAAAAAALNSSLSCKRD